jgi:nicotinamide mononucleotide (NMN) deamidase PncC
MRRRPISDADASGSVTTMLAALNDTLTVLTTVSGGLSAAQISDNGSSSVTLTGAVAQIGSKSRLQGDGAGGARPSPSDR